MREIALVTAMLSLGFVLHQASAADDPLSKVIWFGQSCVSVQGAKGVVIIDPYGLPDSAKGTADLVLVTHSHFDHYDKKLVEKVAKPGAPIYGPKEVAADFPGRGVVVAPGKTYSAAGFSFKTVPAYNISKKYHPKSESYVGYILDASGYSYYFAGDTDFIPEMKGLKPTVAFLPIGGTYTMDWKEAAAAAKEIGALFTVPYHYATLDGVGKPQDAEEFKKATGVKVVILTKK